MNSSEVQYAASERATLFLLKRIVAEIAELKGDKTDEWVVQFREKVFQDVDVEDWLRHTRRPAEAALVAKGIVRAVLASVGDRDVNVVSQAEVQ